MTEKNMVKDKDTVRLMKNYSYEKPAKFYCSNCDDSVVHYFFDFDYNDIKDSYRVKCDRCGKIHWMLHGKELFL